MHVEVVRPGELGPAEAELWAKLQRSSPFTQSPYLSLSFAQAVGRARPRARIAVIEDNGKIVAFLPFELVSRRMAIPIGYPMNDLQGFIHSGTQIDARRVVKKAGLRGWRFLHVPAEQGVLAPFHYSGTTIQCTVVDLTAGYDAYFNSRGGSGRKRAGEKRRALERELGPVSLEWSSSRPEHLHQLIEWKSGKYHGTYRLFAEDGTARPIVEELAAVDNEDCRGIVSVLSADNRPIAIHLGLLGPRGLCSWFPSYDQNLSRFSPGMMMWFPLAEAAAGKGVARIDLGYGQHEYKFHLANDSYPVAGGAVWTSRADELARKIYRRLYHDRRQRESA